MSGSWIGPIVRISPEEVHIDDPDFLSSIYNNSNGRVEKPARVAEQFGPYPAVCMPTNDLSIIA